MAMQPAVMPEAVTNSPLLALKRDARNARRWAAEAELARKSFRADKATLM